MIPNCNFKIEINPQKQVLKDNLRKTHIFSQNKYELRLLLHN